MAGIVHEVENRDLLAQVRQEAAAAAQELAEAAHLHRGQIVVLWAWWPGSCFCR